MDLEAHVVIAAAVVGCLIGMAGGGGMVYDSAQQQAIAHHAAHYDGQTGKFTWNDETQGVK